MLEKYKESGEITKKAKRLARDIVKPGAKLLDIANDIEALIRNEGGKPAFPVNLSINDVGAHYTPDADDGSVVKETDLIKVDIGAHVDGYIADTAITLSMNKDETHLKLIKAAEDALGAAIGAVKPGVKVNEIGAVVEKTITEAGFKPIENLTGHGLDQYSLHAGLTIPNVKNSNESVLEDGQTVAIEPFATTGVGTVYDSNEVHIYEFLVNKSTRQRDGRRILKMAEDDFGKLPFAKRWLAGIPSMKMNMALKELVNAKALYQYPVLKEKGSGLVSQAEHTVIVGEKTIVTT
jgi:methionyl aminopeptidase